MSGICQLTQKATHSGNGEQKQQQVRRSSDGPLRLCYTRTMQDPQCCGHGVAMGVAMQLRLGRGSKPTHVPVACARFGQRATNIHTHSWGAECGGAPLQKRARIWNGSRDYADALMTILTGAGSPEHAAACKHLPASTYCLPVKSEPYPCNSVANTPTPPPTPPRPTCISGRGDESFDMLAGTQPFANEDYMSNDRAH